MARVALWVGGLPTLSHAPDVLSDLTGGVNVRPASSVALMSNAGLSSVGMALHGQGFVLEREEARELIASDESLSDVIRPYRNGRDLTQTPRDVYVIDFGLMNFDEAEEYPVALDIVRTRVKPSRDANKRRARRLNWWLFGEPSPRLRDSISDLDRYIVTTGTAKHRIFSFLDRSFVPDAKLCVIASDDPFHLGVLSSRIHVLWSLASGSGLGVTPVYNNSKCFAPFPFPDPPQDLRDKIGAISEKIDQHRKDGQKRSEVVTLTGIYNVIEKLKSGEELTDKEREIHKYAACGALAGMHEELDRLVCDAYGWPHGMGEQEILRRIVDLHADRIEEEKRGHVRWLRPEYQIPRFGNKVFGGG